MAIGVEDDVLLKRAEAAMAESVRLQEANQRFRMLVWRQLARIRRIEMELDPLLPHPPEELATVRALLAQESAP